MADLPSAQGDFVFRVEPERLFFKITPDGDVVLGEGMTWTAAAEAFWAEVERLAPPDRRLQR